MAGYNEIEEARYQRMLQKTFGVKGISPVKSLAGEVLPVFHLFRGREFRALEGWAQFGAIAGTNAVAAQNSVMRITNPKNSGIIAVIEHITAWAGGIMAFFVEFANSAQPQLANVISNAAFDNRFKPPGTGTNGAAMTLSWDNNVGSAFFTVFDYIVVAANVQGPELVNYDEQEIVMLPDSSLQLRGTNLNTTLNGSLRWRERVFAESERQL